MNKILCPIDFSLASLNALEFAARLAELHQSSLTLIHIFTESEFGEALSKGLLSSHYKQADIDNLIGAAEKVLGNLAEEVKSLSKEGGLVDCDYHFTYGPLQQQLTQYAEKDGYELIVMGTTGVTDVVERFIGSNAVQTIERAHCPVLCVPEKSNYQKFRKVVYASDYQVEDGDILKLIANFIAPTSASLNVLHVAQQENDIEQAMYNDYQERIKAQIPEQELNFAIGYHQDSAHGIDQYVIQEKADLLVLLYQPKNFIQSLLDDSTTKSITYFATYPVLIYKSLDTEIKNVDQKPVEPS